MLDVLVKMRADSSSMPLRERAPEIPATKLVVGHCAGGYRSAAGSSPVAAALPGTSVLDLGGLPRRLPPE